MPALGILFVVGGIFVLRQVIVGRVSETATDAKDLANALLSGDTEGVASVMARRGSNTEDVTGSGSVAGLVDGSSPLESVTSLPLSGSTALAGECLKLGSAAKGYRLGATGPDYYDCSGLVWRAAYKLGIYQGSRFTTATFNHVAPRFAKRVDKPKTGDIAIWVAKGHMGVIVGDNNFYSARSPEKGIASVKLSDEIDYFGSDPEYWRVNG